MPKTPSAMVFVASRSKYVPQIRFLVVENIFNDFTAGAMFYM